MIQKKAGEELVVGLQAMVVQALQHFQEANGVLPDQFVIYRDGSACNEATM